MKCLACNTPVPDDAAQCPECGDPLGQWRELEHAAEGFLGEGAHWAQQGNRLRAALCLTKAAVLRPDDPRALKALGMILAQLGELDDATYYLTRCLTLADPDDKELQAALARIEALRGHEAQPEDAPPEAAAEPVAVGEPPPDEPRADEPTPQTASTDEEPATEPTPDPGEPDTGQEADTA